MQITQQEVHADLVASGWYPSSTPVAERIPEILMRVVCELAKAAEEWRDVDQGCMPRWVYTVAGEPRGIGIEVADAVLILMGLAQECGFDLQGAIKTKMAFNRTRDWRHGRRR